VNICIVVVESYVHAFMVTDFIFILVTTNTLWEREVPDTEPNVEDLNSLTLRNDEDHI